MSEVRKVEAQPHAALPPRWDSDWMVSYKVDGPGTYYIVPEELWDSKKPHVHKHSWVHYGGLRRCLGWRQHEEPKKPNYYEHGDDDWWLYP
jgi:hypothetical protein